MTTRTVSLGDVAEFVNGASFSESDWSDAGMKIIRIQNLTDPRKPFNRTMRTMKDSVRVQPGDLLVSWSATLGVFEWREPEEALLNQHIFRVVPDLAQVDKPYLRHVLQMAVADMERHIHGATMKHINRREFLGTQIPLPLMEEQRRIASILDAADALRAKRRQALEKLETLTQSIFIDMFGSPVEAAIRFGSMSLGDLGEMANGHNFTADDRGNGTSGVLMLDVKNMYTPSIHPDLASAYRVETELPASRYLRPGDLVFVRSSVKREGVAWPAFFEGHSEPVAFCGFLIRLRFHPDMVHRFLPEYLVHYLRQPLVRSRAVASAGQVAITNVSQTRLRELAVPEAPLGLQEDFRERLSAIAKVRTTDNRSVAQLDALFASLQHRAFRGEL